MKKPYCGFLILSLGLSLQIAFEIAFAAPKKSGAKIEVLPNSASEVKVLEGEIRNKNGDKVFFKFRREETAAKSTDEKVIYRRFQNPDGSEALLEEVHYKDEKLKKLQLVQKQLNEAGELEVRGGKLFFKYTQDGKTKTSEEDLEEPLVPSDQIVDHLRSNWSKLEAGETLKIRFPVLERRETVGFNFKIDKKDQQYKSKEVHIVKMWPSSFVIAAIVKPIYFTIEKSAQKRCFVVDGRTAPKENVDGKWKDLDVLMLFHQNEI